MKTPADKTIAFTFYSLPTARPVQRWKARVVFLPGSDDSSSAEVTVTDGDGKPVDDAVFRLASCSMSVKNGCARMSCADFASGKDDAAIWLQRRGAEPIPGALTFE